MRFFPLFYLILLTIHESSWRLGMTLFLISANAGSFYEPISGGLLRTGVRDPNKVHHFFRSDIATQAMC
jgi:hypothetical protein